MTEAKLREFLEANAADIQAAVKEKAIAALLQEHRWDISDQISKTVNEFVAAEIIPAVKAELESRKGVLIEGVLRAIASISDGLAESLTTAAAKNVQDEWKARQIAKAIFGC